MSAERSVISQGSLASLRALRDRLRALGYDAEVVRPPHCDPKG